MDGICRSRIKYSNILLQNFSLPFVSPCSQLSDEYSVKELVYTYTRRTIGNCGSYLHKNNLFLPKIQVDIIEDLNCCLLYTSPSPRDATLSRMPSSA